VLQDKAVDESENGLENLIFVMTQLLEDSALLETKLKFDRLGGHLS
jgi:hypothetical protein